jgi:hypothetical protein
MVGVEYVLHILKIGIKEVISLSFSAYPLNSFVFCAIRVVYQGGLWHQLFVYAACSTSFTYTKLISNFTLMHKIKFDLIPIICITSTRRTSGHCLGTFKPKIFFFDSPLSLTPQLYLSLSFYVSVPPPYFYPILFALRPTERPPLVSEVGANFSE